MLIPASVLLEHSPTKRWNFLTLRYSKPHCSICPYQAPNRIFTGDGRDSEKRWWMNHSLLGWCLSFESCELCALFPQRDFCQSLYKKYLFQEFWWSLAWAAWEKCQLVFLLIIIQQQITAYVWSGHLPSFRSGIGTPGGFMYQKGAFWLCTQHVILLDGTVVSVHHFMAGAGISKGIFNTCHCRSPSRSVAKLGIF